MINPNLKIVCPLCTDAHLDYKPINLPGKNPTHAWTCPACPAILFEYYVKEDAENLTTYLNK